MAKIDLVNEIMAKGRGYKEEGLKNMKVKDLQKIANGLKKSVEDQDTDPEEVEEKQEAAPEEKQEAAPEEKQEEKQEAAPEVPFASYCGFPFDPAHKSDCHEECQKANPEQYQRCVDNYKKVAKPKTGRASSTNGTPKKGKNRWEHLNNSQAEMIDRALLQEKPMSLDEIAEYASARRARTRHHLLHLKKDWKVALSITEGGKVILDERFPDVAKLENSKEFK